MNEKKNIMELINDEQFRTNAETVISALAAVMFVIITKGFISGFSWGLFFTLDPYASGLGVGVAASILYNNMIVRGMSDEILDNPPLLTLLDSIEVLDKQVTDYDYADYFIEKYNKAEYDRLQKLATDTEIRRLKYLIAVAPKKRKKTKLQTKLKNVIANGAQVKNYTPATLQDLLSFNSSQDLKGKDKLNFNPIAVQRKGLLKSQIGVFLASGVMAGLPLVAGDNISEVLIFLAVWIPLLFAKALRIYIRSRNITKTTYSKTLQYKKNVLTQCINAKQYYTPPQDDNNEVYKDNVVKEITNVK